MEDDVSEKPAPGMSYYQVLTGLPPAAPKPRQQEKKVEHQTPTPSDDLPPSGFTPRNIQRNRNTLPKARQKAGPPPEEVFASDNLSRTVSGENVNSQTYYNRGRGRGNYQNSRGSQKPYRGNSRDSSANNSNTLPRSQGGGSRGRGQYGSYGSLPRRGGRQEYGGGEGPNRGNYENRSNGRGRGRGYHQGQSGYQGQSSSQEHVSRAPSQRRIDSLQRKRKMQVDKTKSFHDYEVTRASSLPRNTVKRSLPNLMTSSMTSSFSSSQNIWSPDGKCPSFADILKRATGSEEALEQSEKSEVTVTTITTTKSEDEGIITMEEDTHQDASYTESLAISPQIYSSTRIPEGFGSVPCLTQEKKSDVENASRPPRNTENGSKHISQLSTMASNISLSLFSDNDNVVVSEVATLEHSISQTVQIQNTESEVIKIELAKESVNDNSRSSTDELTFIDKPNKSSSDDNISTSSQKTSRFGAIKSYANILSGGLKKVGSVFGRKSKEDQVNKKEKQNVDIKTESSDSSKSFKENVEPKPVIVNQSHKPSSTEKPEIPGLLFKTDLERRHSKKKRRSRPSSTFDIEGRIENVDNVHTDSKNIESVKPDEEINTKNESTSVERKYVVLLEDYEEIQLTEKDKTNSMRRRNSKKKKKESTPSMKFNDEIDQALHEIKLMDTEEKNKAKENTNSLKRRPSKKSKKPSDHTDEQSKEEFGKQLPDSDTGNIADDEADKERKQASVKLETPKPKPSFSIEKEKEKVPVRITSSFSCERIESLPEIKGDATKARTKLTLAERKQKSYSLNQDSSSYSFSIPDEEEIECLKEDTVGKDIVLKKTSTIPFSSSEIKNMKVLEINKTAIAGLPMDDASDAWMIDDVGTMDSDSDDEVEQTKQTTICEKLIETIEEKVQEKEKESKPAITGLPMDDASEAWMIDDVGTMDSDSDDEEEQIERTTICEKAIETIAITEEKIQENPKETKLAISGLPMDDASDAWMNDDVGTIDSDSDDEVEQNKQTIACEKNIAATEEKIQEKLKDTKPIIAGLPMDNTSDAWMIDDVGTMDADSDDEVEQSKQTVICEKFIESIAVTEEKIQEKPKETKPLIAGLPMNNTSDAWMIDDLGTMDSDSDDEAEQNKQTTISEKTIAVAEEINQEKPKDTKPLIAGLPMDNTCEAWMIDDVGTMDSDSDDEVEQNKQMTICGKTIAVAEEIIQENPKDTKPLIAGLPMDNTSDAWMIDDVGTMDSDSDDKVERNKQATICEKTIDVAEEIIQEKPKDTKPLIAGLPMDNTSEAWMIDDVGTMDSESDDEVEQTKQTTICEKTIAVAEEIIQQKPKDTKPLIAGLPMDNTSDAWMIDDVGTMDSDSDDEVEQNKQTPICEKTIDVAEEIIQEKPKETKPLIAGLPMDNTSDAWMIDDVGTMDSDSDDEVEQNKQTPICDKTIDVAEEIIQEKPKDTKPLIAGLPMDNASEAWMIDDVGTMDSDSDDEVEQSKQTVMCEKAIETIVITEEKIQEKPKETKPAIAGLPMDDASDAWMIDDVGTMDSESDDEVETLICKNVLDKIALTEEKNEDKIKETKPAIAGLPMDNTSDAWMIDDVGTMDSDFEEEVIAEKAEETFAIVKEIFQEKPNQTKPAIAGLPMDDASDAWMNDDFGTMDSEEEDSIKSLEKEKNLIKEKIEEFEEKLSVKSIPSAFAGLPVSDVSDAWMNDDFIKMEDDEVQHDTLPKYSSKDDSISDYDENDKETQMYAVPGEVEVGKVKEGRLSAIEEAKRFSCDDDEENQFTAVAEVVKDVHICDDDESTSWAFVASKEPSKLDETPITSRNLSTSSNPALIVEIIEKVPKEDPMDPDGYKVIKGKTKTRDKRKSKEVPETSIEAIINQLDQPIETQRGSLQTDESSSTCAEDFEIIEKEDGDERISNLQEEKSKVIQKTEEPDHSIKDSNADFVTDDPWLAVKKEYTRKESSTNKKTESTDNAGYTIEVKVSTKETCLGRRLHEHEETEWKMDVQCTQKNTMPDIIEGHDGNNFSVSPNAKDSKSTYRTDESEKKFNSLPRLKTKAISPERLCLSPSWMRKDLSRTHSVESNLGNDGVIFGSVKDRKFSDSRTSCFTSSAETLDEHEDDVYWRLKHKVKKKKRRNQSGPSDAKSRENNELLFSSTKDLLEPLSAEPIIETKEESLIMSNQSIISNSSINTIEEMESETIKTIDTSITKTSMAKTSMEQPNRKISTSHKGIPYEKTMSLEMEALRKESVSPMQIDKESSISVPLESVAESSMKSDISESIKIIKTSVTNKEMHLANTPQLEIRKDESRSVATPSIVLQSEAESKMVGATEIIRATSPMLNQSRPEFKRQNSKEMQQAVEVQRPLSFERQKTLSASLTTDTVADTWVNENHGSIDDDELDKELDDKKKRSSWSSIAATVVSKVAKTKNEATTHRISKHETLVVQAEDDINLEPIKNVDEDGFERCVGKKEMRKKRKSQNLDEFNNQTEKIIQPPCNDAKPSTAGLPMDDASDAWMNDDVGTIESSDEDEVGITKHLVTSAKDVTQSQTKDMKPAVKGLPMDDASDAWMNDDVGIMESDSEDEVEQSKKNKKIETKKEQSTDQRKSFAGLPTDTVTDVWMNDDLGSLDSEEEEEAKPLALTAPSWAGVVSKTSVTGAVPSELPQPPKIVSLKSSKSETLILEADGEEKKVDDMEMDAEGFKEALSRKGKRERKLSKRISVSLEEEPKETLDIIDTDSVQYDLKAIEDAEIKYFESLEQKKNKIDTTNKINSQHVSSEKKPLALAAPSWAGIASKPASSLLEDPDLPMAPQLVTLKHSTSQTLIIEANDEAIADEVEVDNEGFELATSRKVKRERKISKRISLTIDEENQDVEKFEVKTENIGLPTKGNSLIMNLSMDSFWVCKHIFDDAEERYFANKIFSTVPIKEISKSNKKDDEDRDDDDDKDAKKEKNKKTKKSGSNLTNEELETMDCNWTDESTYLSPNIPILKPASLKISAPRDSMQIESHLSKNAINLSNKIKKHIQSETEEHTVGLSSRHKDHDLKSALKVDMDNLQTAVANIDDTLQQLTNEEIDGQLAVVKYTLKTLEELESEAISIEARLQKLPSGSDGDMMSLAATLTGNRTKLVTLHTQAEAQRARIERYMIERRKRVTEIKRYQTLLIDLEQWLGEAQATISTEIRLTSVKVVRDQIRASESLEQDLRTRSTQLEHLLKEVQQLVGYVDVQPLVNDMTSNLGSLHGVMEDAQQCLEHRLKNLQVRCT